MRALVLLLLAGLLVPVAGCFQCQPQLDVRHCADRTDTCDPAATGSVQADWDPALSARFPDLAHLIATLRPGLHGHADWTTAEADELWAQYGVPAGDGVHRQVFLSDGGELFRVRVLPC